MRKIATLLICFIALATTTKAQYVNIPDSNFRSFLIARYPTCFNGAGQMDTTCPSVVNETTLDCESKSIGNLDGFQYFKALKELRCQNNQLTSLPNLPNSLTWLACFANQLTSLPSLPNSITRLFCENNKLTSLPNLPNSIIEIWCDVNQLSSLPKLPNLLEVLSCDSNQLYCLPYVPKTIWWLNCEGNKISCFPNTIIAFGSTNYPLCNPTNNPNGCVSFPVIQGNVYADMNTNNKWDTTEFGRERIKVSLTNGASTFTQKNGFYEISVDSIGANTVSIHQPNLYNVQPTSFVHNFSSYDTLVIDTFALQPNTIKDSLSFLAYPTNWAARPGFSFPYLISAENVGTTNTNPTINFMWDSATLILDSTSNAGINVGNNISWGISNFVPGQIENVVVYFRVKPTTALGDSIKYTATIMGGTSTAIDSGKIIVRGSYDPNDKQATPVLTPIQCALGKDINYTIRFQNTGTDTAFTVVITDTLSNNVLPNTLQIINTSHTCKTTQQGNNISFQFKNILLPDSNINEKKSHGFINFTVKPKPTLVNGNTVENKAYIYFDYNAPIITNTAITQINTSGVVLPVKITSYQASPTPPKEGLKNWTVLNTWTTATETNALLFNIQRSTDVRTFKTFGKVLAKGSNNSYEFIDNVGSLELGIRSLYYRLQIIDKDGSISYSAIRNVELGIRNVGISVYPNPAKDLVNIECAGAKQLLIIDYLGKTVKQFNNITQHQTPNAKQTITLNTQQFNKGIYIVQATMNNGEVKSEKLVVE
jgi:uncharacterized repeat protein (TIGR01451 family)